MSMHQRYLIPVWCADNDSGQLWKDPPITFEKNLMSIECYVGMGIGGEGGGVYSEIMVFKHVLNHIQLDFDILISAHLCLSL